jgi:hypothetical protein
VSGAAATEDEALANIVPILRLCGLMRLNARGGRPTGGWSRWRLPCYISTPQGWEVALIAEPESAELSRAEVALIDEIFATHGRMSRWDLVRLSHELPEWRAPDGSAIPIQYSDILRAGHKTEAEITAVEAELEPLAAVEAMLQPGGESTPAPPLLPVFGFSRMR